jgi:hypothetical protein
MTGVREEGEATDPNPRVDADLDLGLDIGLGGLFPFPQIGADLGPRLLGDPIGDAADRASAGQPEHKPRAFGSAAVMDGINAEGATPTL